MNEDYYWLRTTDPDTGDVAEVKLTAEQVEAYRRGEYPAIVYQPGHPEQVALDDDDHLVERHDARPHDEREEPDE